MTFHELVDELASVSGIDRETLEMHVWKEALSVGANVREEATAFGLAFHEYDARMEAFYRETAAFMIETVVESQRPGKQGVVRAILGRIRRTVERIGCPPKILMLGDGSASDTLAIWREFKEDVDLHYFDVPGSRTADMAQRRLALHGARFTTLNSYAGIPRNHFDMVISLEVLEHLPDPLAAIADMAEFTKIGATCLVTESFDGVSSKFPTHLRSNLKYAGRTPLLFLANNLLLTWYNPERELRFRPMEFTRVSHAGPRDRWRIRRIMEGDRSVPVTLAKLVLKALR